MNDWLYEYYREQDARRFGLQCLPDAEIDDAHYQALMEAVCRRAHLDIEGDCLRLSADAQQWRAWVTGRAEGYTPDEAAWEKDDQLYFPWR